MSKNECYLTMEYKIKKKKQYILKKFNETRQPSVYGKYIITKQND